MEIVVFCKEMTHDFLSVYGNIPFLHRFIIKRVRDNRVSREFYCAHIGVNFYIGGGLPIVVNTAL